jgi:hypothetical protein
MSFDQRFTVPEGLQDSAQGLTLGTAQPGAAP